jgi:hypothetical protein
MNDKTAWRLSPVIREVEMMGTDSYVEAERKMGQMLAEKPNEQNLGNKSLPKLEDLGVSKMESERAQRTVHKARKKSAADLLALVPVDLPILQADLAMSARRAGINEKVQRVLVAELIGSGKAFVWRVRREKSKSAIGYCRRPQLER